MTTKYKAGSYKINFSNNYKMFKHPVYLELNKGQAKVIFELSKKYGIFQGVQLVDRSGNKL